MLNHQRAYLMKAESVHLVRVTTDDRECRIWAAATAREEAVDYVLEHIPEGWSACLLEDVLHDMSISVKTR